MLKIYVSRILLLLTLFVSACAPVVMETPIPTPVKTEEPLIPVTGVAVVQSVEIQMSGSNPILASVVLRGQLLDAGCTTSSRVDQVCDGNIFKLTVITTTDPLTVCAQSFTPFERSVLLNVEGLGAAEYKVEVSGIQQTFQLFAQDVSAFNQSLVDALNKRDYEALKGMMHVSFMLAYWRSEGTAYSPDQAIDQLRSNLLNSSTTLRADPNKDLAAQLGTIIIESVDYSAYPTSVKYILAKQEVRATAMQQAMTDGAYAPLEDLLAAPFRATVIRRLP